MNLILSYDSIIINFKAFYYLKNYVNNFFYLHFICKQIKKKKRKKNLIITLSLRSIEILTLCLGEYKI
jgi:hypothetical protein